MKKFALGIALAAGLLSTAAVAGTQRPTYFAFKAPTHAVASVVVVPAAPKVGKRDSGFGALPLFVPLLGGLTFIGFIALVTTGNNGSPG